ncbi:tellurite resistance protein TehB [Rubidibacter lacunae KORDI 51-2]|uniref:Tellurite resistance protein TehB n=1 Tax=Rubidibacter lacunae KORDI 51-2 TaxID=582515 RepID=U5DTS8_9CHRO|nr:class I SAM-dependent methyltransferase [Rubidibacter lacunae]ERN43075.1 tellurite resistance protein TehB [Rubidibacter lacunae KORDI 51-2]
MENTMYDKNFWNDRYKSTKYLYGTEANAFLVENAHLLHGPVLSLSEGEGRNAVFIAERGLNVLGVDYSSVALEKAQALAKLRRVVVETQVVDLAEYQPKRGHYGSVLSISAHLPSSIREKLYPLIETALKPNGIVLLESYSESQLAKNTGGPKDIDMLMSVDKLRNEFPRLKPILLREIEREVREGEGHTGFASVVQYIARNEEEQ